LGGDKISSPSATSSALLRAFVAYERVEPTCMYVYIGFKTFFYIVRHLDSIVCYLPTGLHLGFCRSWPTLFLPSSFSSVFLVLSFVSASTSMIFWAVFLLPFFVTWPYHVSWYCSNIKCIISVVV